MQEKEKEKEMKKEKEKEMEKEQEQEQEHLWTEVFEFWEPSVGDVLERVGRVD